MHGIGYSADEDCMENVTNSTFRLHNHDEYEIYLFLEGDSKYIVEENIYNLEPYDMIIIRKHEMHRVYHKSNTFYRRFVLMVSPEYFKACPEYEDVFLKPSSDKGNKINADVVRSSGLYDAIMRLKKYSDGFKKAGTPVINGTITEILYILNSISDFTVGEVTNNQLKEVISYINNNYTDEITLDIIEEKFYISKYHLCRIFKEATGLTVQKYIRQKRLTRVSELKREGKNLTEAAILAGFNDYSSFYRAYKNKYRASPGKELISL